MRSAITEITTGGTGRIYHALLDSISYSKPHEFISRAYDNYRSKYPNNPSVNGRIFEYLVCETLAQENITPFYYQAKFERVPNADFDLVLYDPKQPVVLTMKTSLRERWKQADLEGIALKQVYRQARSYLLTLSSDEAGNIQNKIEAGDITGLEQCLVAKHSEYTKLVEELKKRRFTRAEKILPLDGRAYPRPSI